MADAVAASRPQATYGRNKALAFLSDDDEDNQQHAPTSSPPNMFDSSSPVAASKATARRGAALDEEDTGDTTPESSQASAAPIKLTGPRATLTPAQRLAKAMAETDSDLSEDEPEKGSPSAAKGGADAVSRLRALMGGASGSRVTLSNSAHNRDETGAQSLGSDQYTSSLSSAPPVASAEERRARGAGAFDSSSGSEADAEDFASALLKAGRRGATAGRMRRRDGERITSSSSGAPQPASPTTARQTVRPPLDSSDDEEASEAGSSSSPSSSMNDIVAARKQSEAAMQRKQRLADMAAAKRGASPSLEETFFAEMKQQTNAPPSSAENLVSFSDEDSISEGDLPAPTEKAKVDNDRSAHHKKKKSSSKKEKGPKGPKQLSKKEMEEMHKMSAKIERSRPVAGLSQLSRPVQRQQYDITRLAAMFQPAEDEHQAPSDVEIDADPIDMDTPRRPGEEKRGSKPASSAKNVSRLEYGALESFPPRMSTQQAPSSDSIKTTTSSPAEVSEEQREQDARDAALRLKKERWLEAQKKTQGQRLAMATRGPTKEELAESLQVVGKPPLRSKPKPVVGLQATSLFNASLQERIRRQNMSARSAREAANRQQGLVQQQRQNAAKPSAEAEAEDDSMDAIKRIQERVGRQSNQGRGAEDEVESGEEDDEDDEDFVLDEEDGEPQGSRGSDIEGSANEAARGSASEYEDEEEEMPASSQQPPPSSQNTNRSHDSARRTAAADDDDDDDDDDDADVTYTAHRKSRAPQALLDDEDVESVQDQEKRSESTEDIDSSREKAGEVSLGGQDKPLGLTQFLGGFAASPIEMSPQSGSAEEAQRRPALQPSSSSSLLQVPNTGVLGRASSDDSVLGQFFQETQLSEDPRGFSLDVIGATGRARNAENAPFLQGSLGADSNGFSQLFNEGTQLPSALAGSAAGPSQLMGPPTTLPADGFAALRRAAQTEAEAADSPSPLPSNDDFDDDEEDHLAGAGPARAGPSVPTPQRTTPKQYLNREGFFTQTKPTLGGLPSSQSQSQLSQIDSVERPSDAERRGSSADDEEADGDGSPRAARKKRFRRALEPQEDEDEDAQAEAGGEVVEDEEDEEERLNADPAGSGSEVDGEEEVEGEEEGENLAGSGSEAEDGEAPGTLHPGATRNAWDILRQGQARAEVLAAAGFKQQGKKRQRDYQFIEGEAEESDEDDEGRRNKKGAGGLDGVFSDSGSDDGEEDDEEDDGRDLEELVDNEREMDEADKDLLARERYQKDLDADDEAAMALADKAARGELRNKRRLRDGDRLEDLLDDDFEDERLLMKANNPRAIIAKRRKIEGDEMEILAAKEESQAFVKGYSETHRADVADEYDFLAEADTDEDSGGDGAQSDSGGSSSSGKSDEEDEADEAGDKRRVSFAQAQADDQDDEEEVQAVQRVTRKQLARELRERRQRRKQGIVSDEDDEAETSASQHRNGFGSGDSEDEDDFNSARPRFLRDRLAERKAMQSKVAQATSRRRPAPAGPTKSTSASSSFFSRRPAGQASASVNEAPDDIILGDDDEDDEDDPRAIDPSAAIQARILRRQAARRETSPRTAARLAKLAEEFRSEPDFAAGRSRSFGSGGGGGGGAAGSSVTSWGAQPRRQGSAGSMTLDGGLGGGKGTATTLVRKMSAKGEMTRPVLGRAILAERRVEESQ
ncbi:hypothetical protein BCV69DRAFT_282699 [Microstroma glucosiphilum]|uniref:DNA replication checkpoint mediator MRC1 domain-containing protein n=1 Tax=Pseudomicrostroma glucosiphilum TaxID=1684307 RepID=A0A316U7S2_9BASI|nr:hypothetical protein BCV69DRAFT_282699 [Pseudomicrostroma glucosiphilum]PWN21202.1 hypothetical protein BCV69DRAFT_282699 [Pseudomicrostroma glucosiphilum]